MTLLKKVLSCAAILSISVFMVGCGGDDSEPEAAIRASESDTAESTTDAINGLKQRFEATEE